MRSRIRLMPSHSAWLNVESKQWIKEMERVNDATSARVSKVRLAFVIYNR